MSTVARLDVVATFRRIYGLVQISLLTIKFVVVVVVVTVVVTFCSFPKIFISYLQLFYALRLLIYYQKLSCDTGSDRRMTLSYCKSSCFRRLLCKQDVK